MAKVPVKNNSSYRRRAFRVYEQVDLVYHKLGFNRDQLSNTDFNNILNNKIKSFNRDNVSFFTETIVESQLPSSSSQQNETLNINISSSGVSFTSKEELVAGEYIMMRVLLLSSMIAITTCCKVVYSKVSNPYENNQYPFTVGVRFVKLKFSDKDLLDQHIRKKRRRIWTVNALMLGFLFIVIQVPDLFFELCADLFSFVIDELIEVLHLLYELIEFGLDIIVENVFHTEIQTTQTLVFYLQNLLLIGLSVPLIRVIILFCKNQFKQWQLFLYRKKSSIVYFWGEQTVLYKAVISCLSAGLLSLSVWGLS